MSIFRKLFGRAPVRVVLVCSDGEERVRLLRHDEQGKPYALSYESLSCTRNYLADDGELEVGHSSYVEGWKPFKPGRPTFPSFEGVPIGARE